MKILIILLFSITIYAQADNYSQLFRLASFKLQTNSIDDSIITLVSDSLNKELKSIGLYYIIPKEELMIAKNKLNKNKKKILTKYDYTDLARMVAADKLCYGSIKKENTLFKFTFKMYDIESKKTDKFVYLYSFANIDSIYNFIPSAIGKMFYPKDTSYTKKNVFNNYSPKENKTKLWEISTVSLLAIGLMTNTFTGKFSSDDDQTNPVDSMKIIKPESYEIINERASFINNGFSARARAMADAYCAIADDGLGFLYNPSGITKIKESKLDFSFINRSSFVKEWAIGYSNILAQNQFFGNAFVYSGDGGLMNEWTFTTNYAYLFSNLWKLPKFSLGTNIKLRSASFGKGDKSTGIDKVTGNAIGFGLDLGGTAEFTKDITGGLSLIDIFNYLLWRNNLTNNKYNEPLPSELKMGLAYKTNDFLTISMEWFKAIHDYQSEAFSFGLEYTPLNFLALRAGWFQDSNDENLSKINAGIGFNYLFYIPPYANLKVNIDYSFEYFKTFGNSHRITLGFNF